jgi:hypothetical protein
MKLYVSGEIPSKSLKASKSIGKQIRHLKYTGQNTLSLVGSERILSSFVQDKWLKFQYPLWFGLQETTNGA